MPPLAMYRIMVTLASALAEYDSYESMIYW